MKFSIWMVFTMALLHQPSRTIAGYLQEDEDEYLRNFDGHMASSYAVGDHAERLNICRSAPEFYSGYAITVRATSKTSSMVTSSDVQLQCHESYLCVIPESLTVEMTTSLHVGALLVHGSVIWTDDTQSQDEAYLCAGYVVAEEGGSFLLRLQSAAKRAWIYLVNNGAFHEVLGWRAFGGIDAATIELLGRPLQRTWTLLDQPLLIKSTTLQLLHNPAAMGWQVGDRVGVAPTESQSKGIGQAFTITHIASDGTVLLDGPSIYDHKAEFIPSPQPDIMPPILMSAEVVNLSRNIVVTGDDFENVPCDPNVKHEAMGCMCTDYRRTCTVGLHTVMAKAGTLRISNVRLEKCGQRGILGKYCMHFHKMQDCPNCLISGNAIESSQQRGIVIHDTHRSLVERNVMWNVRGAGVYVEDGNEMHNSLEYNVIICPFPIDDPRHHGCTVPGTQAGSSDDRRNQASFYLRSSTNDMIGNRASNSRNGMFAQSGADGEARGNVCSHQTAIGRWEGNTFHGHARFGTYPIKFYPQETDRTVETDGYNVDQKLCEGFDKKGNTNGLPVAIVNHLDYDNIFVGQYDVGDIQYRGHASLNNKNLMYWKESKNFEGGCAAHIAESFYSNGNLALPDQATVILENTVLEDVSLEANHHCKVGTTGFLCMPQYILHNVLWRHEDPSMKWMYFQHGDTEYGGIFTLSPDSGNGSSPFPEGYISLVANRFDYLLDAPNNLCKSTYHLGMGERYDNGILCKAPLRAFKIYTRGLDDLHAPPLKMQVWFDNKDGISAHSRVRPSSTQFHPFHQIGDRDETNRQGYSFPVIPSPEVSYRLSLGSEDRDIPKDWVIEFSDPVVGNRWGEEYMQLELLGRPCIDDGIVSSHHDRRFIFSGTEFMDDNAWKKHGACVKERKMPAVTCPEGGYLEASECAEYCDPGCGNSNSYCDCRTARCRCKVGFMGDDCSIDLCADTCGSHGTCSGLYLGATLPIHSIGHACIEDQSMARQLKNKTNRAKLPSSGLETQLRVGLLIEMVLLLLICFSSG